MGNTSLLLWNYFYFYFYFYLPALSFAFLFCMVRWTHWHMVLCHIYNKSVGKVGFFPLLFLFALVSLGTANDVYVKARDCSRVPKKNGMGTTIVYE